MVDIDIGELRENDYKQYCNLLQQLTVIHPEKINLDNFKKHFDLIKLNPLHKIMIAYYNDIIVGTITVLIEPKFIHDLSYVAHIEDLVVDSHYRCRGISKILINAAINVALQNNCYKIILNCSDEMVTLYEKNGFNKKGYEMVRYL